MTEIEEAVARVKEFLRVNRLVGEGFIRNGQILSWKTFDTILSALERAERERDEALATWPDWAVSIRAKLQFYGVMTDDDQGGCDLAEVFDEWVDGYAQSAEAELAALKAEVVEVVGKLRVAASLLQANAEGCAANHYGEDFAEHGMPGWLADTAADIEAARDLLAKLTGETL